MASKTRSAGFSPLAVIGAILVVTFLIFGGWYVWHSHKNDSKNKSNSELTGNTDTKDQLDQQSDPSENGKYLVIQEWGVRVPLPAELQGDNVYYQIRHFEESYGSADGADIGVKTFTPECHANNAQDLGLTIVRTRKALDSSAPYIYKLNVISNQDGYWFHGAFGKDGCSKLLSGEKAQQFQQLYQAIGDMQKY